MVDPESSRKLKAILASGVAGYSRLMQDDDEATVALLEAYRAVFREKIEAHHARVVDMAGDSVLAVFEAPTDAVRTALEVQSELAQRNEKLPEARRMRFRIGVNIGEVIERPDGTVYGDGVNVAARLESIGEPGGVCISGTVYDQVKSRVNAVFECLGEQQVKNMAEPVRAFRVRLDALGVAGSVTASAGATPELALPDTSHPSPCCRSTTCRVIRSRISLPTVSSRRLPRPCRGFALFLSSRVTRPSATKAMRLTCRKSAGSWGVRYVLEGSVQKAGGRVRITVQLIDVTSGAHVWADRVDGTLEDVFDLQDRITERVAGALQPSIRLAEIERARRKRPQDLSAYDYTMRAMPQVWALEKDASEKALEFLNQALAIDPEYPLALSLAGWCYAQRSVYN